MTNMADAVAAVTTLHPTDEAGNLLGARGSRLAIAKHVAEHQGASATRPTLSTQFPPDSLFLTFLVSIT